MENNFDKIFKDKLEHRKFEMKPEYWEGAESLITADEKSRDWRRFFVWFGVAMIAGLAIFFIWKNDTTNELAEKEKTPNTTLENTLPKTIENTKTTDEVFNKKTSSQEKSNIENNLSSNIEGNKISVNTLEPAIEESNSSKKSTSQSISKSNSLDKTKSEFSTTIPYSETQNNGLSGIKTKEKENNNAKLNTDTNTNENNPIIAINDDGNNDDNIVSLIENERENNEENSNTEEIAIQPIASNATVLLPFLEMFLANNKKVRKLDLNTVWSNTPSRDKFAFGGFGGAVGYPLTENNSDNLYIGFKTGLILERNFQIGKADMALGTELTYHYRSGNFVATKQNEVASYSFGRSVAQRKLTPESLHYFELPLYLKYQKKRMTLETGASFNYLLGVRGTISEVDGTSQTGWVPSLGFKNNYVNVLLGFHYRISDNLHFGVRANYTPGGILDKEAVLPDGITVALQESRPFYLTFRLTQYLKFRK